MRASTAGSCSVTGLPVHDAPGLTQVQLGDNYRLSVTVVGDRIIHVKPMGVVTLDVLKLATAQIRQLVEEVVPAGQDYAQIDDYSGLASNTLAARKYYMDEIRARERLAGVVYCGASPLLVLSIKLGLRINAEDRNVALVDDYTQAVWVALSMLAEPPLEFAPVHPLPPAPPAAPSWAKVARQVVQQAGALGARLLRSASRSPPASPGVRPAQPRSHAEVPLPALDLDLEGLQVRYKVIDGDVLLALTRGYMQPHHVAPVVEANRAALEAVGGPGPYFLLNQRGVLGVDFRARRDYIRQMIQVQRERPFKMAVFYSADRMMRALITLSRPLAPFPVEVAANQSAALELVAQDRRRGEEGLAGSDRGASAYLADLLRFMSSIDWERQGLGSAVPQVLGHHPLRPAFDAIEVLKNDVDQLLRQRQQGEDALRQSEALLRTVIDATNEAIISVDRQGRVELFSAAAVDLFGCSSDQAHGRSFEDFLAPTCRQRWSDLLARYFDHDAVSSKLVEFDALRSDGAAFPLELSLARADYDSRRYTIVVGRDLTEAKRAVAEKARLERQLHHSQRIRSLGTLAGGIAHDVNNLLMAIQGHVSLLRIKVAPGSEDEAFLKTIEGQVRSGTDLTGQLLACARKGRYRVEVLDLNCVVTQICETFWRTNRGIRVHTDLQPALPAIEADQSQIEQIVLNLALNAGDAMPHGGELRFITRGASAEELPEEVEGAEAQPFVLLEVSDTGQGIDDEALEQIFEPFFTTKEMGHGTGLGLASVYGSVKAHGGQITVRSEVGHGTIFRIYMPATTKRPHEEHQRPVRATARCGVVLVVDDDPVVLAACTRLLQVEGYTVLSAEGGLEALEIYAANRERIDLVILDLVMPDLGGGETFDRLRALDPTVKVLLSSGYSQRGEAQAILDRGCDSFIHKPFDLDQLITRIVEILGAA